MKRRLSRPGEDEELKTERERLKHAERLSQGAGEAYQTLYGEDRSVVGALGTIKAELEKLSRLDGELAPILERIEESSYVLGGCRARVDVLCRPGRV